MAPDIFRNNKSAVSKSAHESKFVFAWQPHYHDHIVTGPDQFRRIYDYISNIPKNWKDDKKYF